MPIGEIFVGTFRQIWQHKKLWVFGLLAALLGSVGLGIYQLFGFRWQSDYMQLMSRFMRNPEFMPQRFGFEALSSLGSLGVGFTVLILFSLIGYIISLVMRGAIMHEAAVAWSGGRTDASRGVSAGVGRAVYVFLIDLLWGLLPLVLICGVMATLFGLILTTATLGGNEGSGGFLAFLFIGFMCSVVCVSFLLAIVVGIFPPLMYQSAVVGQRSAGAAVAEGWRLTRDNLGALIIFWLLLLLLGVVLGALVQGVILVLTLPSMGPWMAGWSGAMEDFMLTGQLDVPPLRLGWLIVSGFVALVLSLLLNSFLLTFRHTLYAEVYRRLTGAIPAVAPTLPVEPQPVEPPAPAASAATPGASAPLVPIEPPPDAILVDEPPADEEPPRVG